MIIAMGGWSSLREPHPIQRKVVIVIGLTRSGYLQTDSKSFRSAHVTLTGIELMHMIRKGQLRTKGKLRPAQAFYSLAA
jgi:hypothetical protein